MKAMNIADASDMSEVRSLKDYDEESSVHSSSTMRSMRSVNSRSVSSSMSIRSQAEANKNSFPFLRSYMFRRKLSYAAVAIVVAGAFAFVLKDGKLSITLFFSLYID